MISDINNPEELRTFIYEMMKPYNTPYQNNAYILKQYIKDSEIKAKIDALKSLRIVFEKYTWGNYDPFTTLDFHISEYEQELAKLNKNKATVKK